MHTVKLFLVLLSNTNNSIYHQGLVCTVRLSNRFIGHWYVVALRVRVYLRVITMKRYSFPRTSGLEPHHQMFFVISRAIVVGGGGWGSYPLCIDAVGVFYSSLSRPGRIVVEESRENIEWKKDRQYKRHSMSGQMI